MYPRIQVPSVQSSLDQLRKIRNEKITPLVHKSRDFAERQPRRTLAATAIGAVAVAGITTGLAAGGSGQPAHQFGHASAISQVEGGHAGAGQQSHQVTRTMQKTTDSGPSSHAAPPEQSAPAKHAAPSGPTKPYLVYDSVTPSSIPSKQVAAVYATGGFAASPSQVSGHPSVVWIDTNGSDPKASALDVEPGDVTPSQAASWAKSRLSANPDALARIYTMRSEWGQVKAAVAGLPQKMQDHVRWWIADPTGQNHSVPGAAATQWFWGTNYDITTASPRF